MANALNNKPVLNNWLLPYYAAFNALNARRQYSMAELPIQVSEIDAYSKRFGFDADFSFFYRAITELDEEYLIRKAAEREADSASKREKGKSSKSNSSEVRR